jgi:hypothetical protein
LAGAGKEEVKGQRVDELRWPEYKTSRAVQKWGEIDFVGTEDAKKKAPRIVRMKSQTTRIRVGSFRI